MYLIILFVALAVLGYFVLKASRYGALEGQEILIFAIISAAFAGYLIFIILKLA